MKTSPPVVLAITPGTREFGVAIFHGFELVYFGVKTFKREHSVKRLKSEVSSLLKELCQPRKPQHLAIKEINQYQRKSSNLFLIADFIKKQAHLNEIPVVEVSLAQVRHLLGAGRKPTQTEIFQKVATLYPELRQYQNRPSKWQGEYYTCIFSAVAAGLVCLNDLASQTD